MHNPRLAARYAKSLLGLALEQNQLEKVYQDVLYLQQVCRVSKDFVTILKSPVIKADKKLGVLNGITEGKTGELVSLFNKLLVTKGREYFLPEILTAFIEQYKKHKGIYSIRLTTAAPVSDELKQQIIQKVQDQTIMKQIELESVVNEDIIGGFVLEIGDNLVDASISYDLNKIKAQFMNNDFIYKIR